jgi:signal transduction histidine kinase
MNGPMRAGAGVKPKRWQFSLTVAAVALVLAMAALAAGSLWALRTLQRQTARTEARRMMGDEGALMTAYLAGRPVVRAAGATPDEWSQFSALVRSFHTVENGLQYVAVVRDGVTVFHEQLQPLAPAANGAAVETPRLEPDRVGWSRALLQVGARTVPVVVFAIPVMGEDGKPRRVEVALRRDVVEREEKGAARAIAVMFRVSLAAVVFSFALCAVLMAWVMRREHRRETLRREEEHLTFAGMLANGIAHDFRNPMSALRLDAQMLEKEAGKGAGQRPDRLVELAQRIRGTLDRMDKVFTEFLQLSRPDGEQRQVAPLAALVREVTAMLAARLEKAGVHVAEQGFDLPVRVAVHPPAIQRALMNVLINAVQASRPGDGIELRLRREGDSAILEVQDQGPGIPEADREHVFDLFYSKRPGGTGLGLFLARSAIERHGGTASFIPCGRGACFRMTLPAVEEKTDG